MSTREDVIDEERERFLAKYFKQEKIDSAKDKIREAMRQARQKKGFGIMSELGKSPTLTARLLGLKSAARAWSRADLGKIKSAITRKVSLSKLAATLGRSPNGVYKAVRRYGLRKR